MGVRVVSEAGEEILAVLDGGGGAGMILDVPDKFEPLTPGIAWKENAITEKFGQKWIRLEMASQADDSDIHNLMLVTGPRGSDAGFSLKLYEKRFFEV